MPCLFLKSVGEFVREEVSGAGLMYVDMIIYNALDSSEDVTLNLGTTLIRSLVVKTKDYELFSGSSKNIRIMMSPSLCMRTMRRTREIDAKR